VEEVIGLIVDALAKGSRGQKPSQPGKPPQRPAPPPAGRLVVRVPATAQRPASSAAPVASPAAVAQRPAPAPRTAPPPADPFAAAVVAAPHPSPQGASLLSAFTSRERLLAAIVLSEALGAPVALRNDNSLRSRDVLGPDVEN